MIQRMTNSAIEVLLAHHSNVECKLLIEALRSGGEFRIARCGSDSSEILKALHGFRADVVLLALGGSSEQLCSVVRAVHRIYPYSILVAMIGENHRTHLAELFRVGLRGVIDIATAEIGLICKCIVQVHGGHFWISSRELDIVLQEFSRSSNFQILNRRGRTAAQPS